MRIWSLTLAAVALTLAATVTACGDGDSTPSTDVEVILSEWEITATPKVLPAGDARLEIANTGEFTHRLVVVKSDLPPAELPTVDGAIDVAKLNIAASANPMEPTAQAVLTLNLTPGKYVLLCDVVSASESHYREGMHFPILVEP